MDASPTDIEALRARIATFPKAPGVYLMKDAAGTVLYIGKAKDLRSRVSSYFQPSADLLNTRGPEIARMVTRVADIDFSGMRHGSGRTAERGPADQGHSAAAQRHAQGR
jgi:excinuclease UvrABC nuclease subunit